MGLQRTGWLAAEASLRTGRPGLSWPAMVKKSGLLRTGSASERRMTSPELPRTGSASVFRLVAAVSAVGRSFSPALTATSALLVWPTPAKESTTTGLRDEPERLENFPRSSWTAPRSGPSRAPPSRCDGRSRNLTPEQECVGLRQSNDAQKCVLSLHTQRC